MAACKQTAFELIQDVFSPCVALLCSSDVQEICAKNNLTFAELVQPFSRLCAEVTIRDPSNMPCAIKNLRVKMKDLHSQLPVPSVGKKMMSEAVSSNILASSEGMLMTTVSFENYHLKCPSSTPWFEAYREVFFQVTSPTEHEFVHNYLSCIFVVSSSHQDPLSQLNELSQQLSQHQQNSLHSSKWFFSYAYTYYLLLHDVSTEDLGKAEAIFQSMKSSYGPTCCHLLQINSIDPSINSNSEDSNGALPDPWTQFLPKYNVQNDSSNKQSNENIYDAVNSEEKIENEIISSRESYTIHHPLLYHFDSSAPFSDPLTNPTDEADTALGFSSKIYKNTARQKKHGACLTLSDMDRIKCFVQEFCVQGLIPFVERQIRTLNEQVANRKGIHRTLFGVTKKFFGNKPGVQNPSSVLNSVVYGPDAPELQVRKLGDLAFMFQLYEVAYQAYHSAKKDFSADQAWLHYAGASEMTALSVFMQNSTLHDYPSRYIENAINTYLHPCKLPDLATRATFLSTECFKAKGMYRDAALQFTRWLSLADLPIALCLEQAAYCYLNCKPPRVRKYAFYNILAGYRYNKAGHKKHALRVYKQAEQVYRVVSWNFAKNHLDFTIGRLSLQLNQLETACSAFEPLLMSKYQLPPIEQANYLREYLYVLKGLMKQKGDQSLPILPVPFFLSDATKVLLSEDTVITEGGPVIVKGRGFDRGDLNNHVWSKLEEIVTSRLLNLPVFTSQLQCLTSRTNNASKPNAIVGEVISLEIMLKNPLSISLVIDDVFPLWTFTAEGPDAVPISNEQKNEHPSLLSSIVLTKVLARVTLEPLQEKKIYLLLTPQQVGTLSIQGVAYSLLSLKQLEGEQVPDAMNLSAVMSQQGKQCLKMRGPRRNKTAEDRASVVYAEDNRLNLNILAPAAKLQVKFQQIPTSLFCGEVLKVVAEFSNLGHCRLKRIFLASPTPGIFAIGTPGDSLDRHELFKQVPTSRQMSPVIAKWESDWMCEILMPDGEPCLLEPGASFEIPVWFKGPDTPGDHDLDILFYYETEPAHPKLKYRVLQLSTVLVTYPSMNVSASAMRSFCSEDNATNFHPAAIPTSLIISAEVENISQELSQVSLVQFSCISKHWCFLPSIEHSKGLSVIHPEETLLLTLKAIGFDPKSTVSSQEVKVFSNIPFGIVEVDSSSIPCSDFCQKAGFDLRTILPADSEPRNVPTVKECNQLLAESDLVLLLVIIWKAKVCKENSEIIVTGQHHVPIHSLTPSTALPKTPSIDVADDISFLPIDTEIESVAASIVPSVLTVTSMVKCSLKYPFYVEHCFSRKRRAIVPVELIVRSTCDVELHVIISNLPLSDSKIGQNVDEKVQLSSKFSWVSGSRHEMDLKPHTTAPVPLKALFCAPGTYDLSNLNIEIHSTKDSTVLTYQLLPHLIVVKSCDTT